MGYGPDVIFVAVRDKNAAYALATLRQPGEVRVFELDAQVVVGKADPAVDDNDAVATLERQAIHANLAQPPERYAAHGLRRKAIRHERRLYHSGCCPLHAGRRPRATSISAARARRACAFYEIRQTPWWSKARCPLNQGKKTGRHQSQVP